MMALMMTSQLLLALLRVSSLLTLSFKKQVLTKLQHRGDQVLILPQLQQQLQLGQEESREHQQGSVTMRPR
jgi:hypothetical protein